jgi:hypothetical protein
MSNITLKQLPLAVRLACAFFAAWLGLENIVIEPNRLYRFMPFYRVDSVCVWDISVALLLLGLFVVAPEIRRRNEAAA